MARTEPLIAPLNICLEARRGPSERGARAEELSTMSDVISSPKLSEDAAERWVRVLRMHGQVGVAMQALGVGEAPLETQAQPRAVRLLRERRLGEDIVEIVAQSAYWFATERGSSMVATV